MVVERTKYEEKIKVKKGDEVLILAGEDRGTKGKVERVDYKNMRVVVAGARVAKRHTKPSIQNQDGGIIEKELGIHVSNVAVIDPSTKKPTRIGYKVDGGKKVRVARKSGKVLS